VAGAKPDGNGDTVVCGRDWPGLPCIGDKPEPGLGPLGGLNAALHHARACGHDLVLCAPLDVVPLTPALVGLLEQKAPTVVAGQRVIGLWPVSLAATLDAWLASGERSVRGWVAESAAREITIATPLRNINRPGDLLD
jgi:molybdenum cofactor guanylyltransferase